MLEPIANKPIYFSGTPQLIQFPSVDSDTDAFSFSVNSSFGVFGIEAHWVSFMWKLYITLPSGSIREATVWPQVRTWQEFSDYMLLFYTPSTTEVTHDDIVSTTIGIIKR
jgi:hypothetical protein